MRDDFSGRQILLLALLLLLGSFVPLLLVDMAPIADLPNHLARAHILRSNGADATLNQYYEVAWGVLPNLVMDWFLVGLDWFSLYAAGSLLVGLSFLAILAGVLFLRYTLYGSLSILALLAVLLFYNRIMLWGMVNYMLATGVMLVALAVWIRLREAPAPKRVVISSAMALLVFFCHLFPFGIYALAVGAYELQSLLKPENRCWPVWRRTMLVGGVQFIAPVVCFLFLSPTAEYAVSRLAFGDFSRKLFTVPFMTFNNYSLPLDIFTFGLVAGLVLALLVLRAITIKKDMLGVLVLLTVTHFAMPQYLMSSPGADLRTFFPLLFIAIASVDLVKGSRTVVVSLTGALIVLFAVRIGVVTENWVRADRDVLPEYKAAIGHLPRGARLGTYFYLQSDRWFANPPHQHYSTLAIIEKAAFVPNLFAHPGQQPIKFVEAYRTLAERAPSIMVPPAQAAEKPDPLEKENLYWMCRFADIDYLMVSNAGSESLVLPLFLLPVFQGKNVSVFEVDLDDEAMASGASCDQN